MAAETGSIMDHLDTTTLVSLSAVLVILFSSYGLSLATLASDTPKRLRILFIWHFFDFLIHSIFEGSFLCVPLLSPPPNNPTTKKADRKPEITVITASSSPPPLPPQTPMQTSTPTSSPPGVCTAPRSARTGALPSGWYTRKRIGAGPARISRL